MAQLIVRNLEDEVVHKLKLRAAQNNRSAEEEHRQILREALQGAQGRTPLKKLLMQFPDVGDDSDFERPRDPGRPVEL